MLAKDWKHFETDHFIVHYYTGVEETAYKAATIAEEIYGPITSLYQYEPKEKVQLIFKDTEDYSNGGAYYFENKIEIWAENLDFVLRGTHHWLRDVITHEFTHIISIQKAMKMGKHVPGIYFQFFHYEKEKREDVVRGFPNMIASLPYIALNYPVWFAEGVAQYQCRKKHYDYRDSHREMILRDRILNDNLLSLEEMSTFGKTSIGNESSYNQGFAFVMYLAETYGEEKLREIAGRAKKIQDFTFDQTIRYVFHKSLKNLYKEWKTYLKEKYQKQYNQIKSNLEEGTCLEKRGFGNLYPIFSPNGQKIAYISNTDKPYFGDNVLIVAEHKNGVWEKTIIDKYITSSLTWSPDSRYLVYSKQIEYPGEKAVYNDLYLFDMKKNKRYRITRNMRARNPDWRPGSNQIVAVVSHDGNTNLVLIEVDVNQLRQKWNEKIHYGFHVTQHVVKRWSQIPDSEKVYYHPFYVRSNNWKYITHYFNGRQFFHPRWSPDGKQLITDTSIEFTRNIVEVNPENGSLKPLISGRCDYRDPAWSRDGKTIYFASDTTGIFNIYKMDLSVGKMIPVTCVTGGAFQPSVNDQHQIVFSEYKNAGYKIALVENSDRLQNKDITVIDRYDQKILHTDPTVKETVPTITKPSRPKATNILFFPKILLDYGTVKPGFYLFMPELLNRLEVLGSFDINARKDIFYYLIFTSRMFKKEFNFEVYNQISNIKVPFRFPGDTVRTGIRFNLLEFNANVNLGSIPLPFLPASRLFQWKLQYVYNRYSAKISPLTVKKDIFGNIITFPEFRYTYLKGHRIHLIGHMQTVKNTLEKNINPQDGIYIGIELTGNFQRFLVDFSAERSIGLEVFRSYNYFQLITEIEGYYHNPILKSHTFDMKIQSGFIDRKVDDFFNLYAGGLMGLKGFPYYSIEGRKMFIGSFYYRFPIFRNINKKLGVLYFKHLFMAPFYQMGNAWNGNFTNGFQDLKKIVGLQVRLSLFSYYFVPLSVFYELAYPLASYTNTSKNITYPKQVRHYFGILFSFDIRMTNQSLFKMRGPKL
jgi:Tol biopolymer transport system component